MRTKKNHSVLWLVPALLAVFAAGCRNSPTVPATPTAVYTSTAAATMTRTSTAAANTATVTRTSTTAPVNTATSTLTQAAATDTVTMTVTETATAISTATSTATTTSTIGTGIVVPLAASAPYGVLGGSAGMTNQGIYTRINNGDIGTTGASTLVTGFHDVNADIYTETPLNIGEVSGTVYCDAPAPGTLGKLALAQAALSDASTAYNYLAALPAGSDPNGANPGELGGLTLDPGTYTSASGTFQITLSDLVLDGKGDPNAVFVFQMASSLTVGDTAPRSVSLIGSAQAKNVYWQVGSNAVINAAGGGTMAGTIICNAGAAFSTAGLTALTVLDGRVLSLGASVTLVNTIINVQ